MGLGDLQGVEDSAREFMKLSCWILETADSQVVECFSPGFKSKDFPPVSAAWILITCKPICLSFYGKMGKSGGETAEYRKTMREEMRLRWESGKRYRTEKCSVINQCS